MAARSDAGEAGLEKKVLKKAKAAETSADAILKLVTKNEGTKEPAAAAQFLGGLFAAHKNPFHAATYFTRSVLACLAALASQREGAAVPATFEGHVQRMVHGYPMNISGLDRLAEFCLAAFRALGPARAAAFVELAQARDDERQSRSLSASNTVEATLAALASEDAAVRARLGAPTGVPPSIAALWVT